MERDYLNNLKISEDLTVKYYCLIFYFNLLLINFCPPILKLISLLKVYMSYVIIKTKIGKE